MPCESRLTTGRQPSTFEQCLSQHPNIAPEAVRDCFQRTVGTVVSMSEYTAAKNAWYRRQRANRLKQEPYLKMGKHVPRLYREAKRYNEHNCEMPNHKKGWTFELAHPSPGLWRLRVVIDQGNIVEYRPNISDEEGQVLDGIVWIHYMHEALSMGILLGQRIAPSREEAPSNYIYVEQEDDPDDRT